ncbi:TMPIT-like protein-domain-containing protein, partial [Fimicolochytrium jonesii]|uniref:TMPIT-like protein-domain-containing protein n=1 Tax=Fimicolochytrium jonesii TaxID=1396493 RepID=UPI0022FED7E4
EKLELIRRKIQHLEFQFPKPAHIILRLALGSYAPVSLKPLQLRLQYKQEYEIFKLRFSLIFLAFSVLGLGVIRNRAFDAIFGFAILYYYCTCILREHILLVNGSRIRSWWFGHHYLSIILSGVLLIWPSTPAYRSFRTPFFAFAGFMQVMQYLQYRYQRSRLYVLVTLDRARPMDTVAGDGFFSASMEREFFLLVPFLVIGQLWQLYNAYILYVFWHTSEGQEGWQGLAAAILFAILGVGNTVTTLRTWRAKKKGASLPSSLMPGSPPITSPLASPTSPTSSAPLNGNGSVAPSAPQPATAAQEEYPFPAVKSQHKPNISKLSER